MVGVCGAASIWRTDLSLTLSPSLLCALQCQKLIETEVSDKEWKRRERGFDV